MAIKGTIVNGGHQLLFSNLPSSDSHPTLIIEAHGVKQTLFSSFKKKKALELNFYAPSGKELSCYGPASKILEFALRNALEISEAHTYGKDSWVRNHDLADITKQQEPGMAFLNEADAIRIMTEMDSCYQMVLQNEFSEALYGKLLHEKYQKQGLNQPINLFNSMPSLLLITNDTDLKTVLNTPELQKYKRIMCSFCRGSSWNPFSGQYFYTNNKHAK